MLTGRSSKLNPEKLGVKAVAGKEINNEFTPVFELDNQHNSTVSMDLASLIIGISHIASEIGTTVVLSFIIYFPLNTGKKIIDTLSWSNNYNVA